MALLHNDFILCAGKCQVMSTGGGSPDSQVKYRLWIWGVLQPQAEAAAAGAAPKEAVQALGADPAEGSGLGS